VNLCLSVGDVRGDGYHDIQTVMHVLELADEVVVTAADRLSIVCRPSVGVADERNLAYKAAAAFGESFGTDVTVSIDITKRIPAGAGLGGGSSDAAAVIAALAELNGVARTDARCLNAARAIGADAAFFLYGPAAQLSGRGDELVRTLPALECPVALVHPGAPVPTVAAYAAFDADPQPPVSCDGVAEALESRDIAALADELANNLEVASASVVPDVARVLSWLRGQPEAMCGVLAGSGSAAFAIVDSEEAAERICDAARSMGWWAVPNGLHTSGITVTEESSTV
jgi:4-diphosphocytidyl-2-C-methyl-D-erythritol kinase